jgi:hypothetical protein
VAPVLQTIQALVSVVVLQLALLLTQLQVVVMVVMVEVVPMAQEARGVLVGILVTEEQVATAM